MLQRSRFSTAAAGRPSRPPTENTAERCSARSTAAGTATGASRCAAAARGRRRAAHIWRKFKASAVVQLRIPTPAALSVTKTAVQKHDARHQPWMRPPPMPRLPAPCHPRYSMAKAVLLGHMIDLVHACLSQSPGRASRSSCSAAATPRCGTAGRAMPSRGRASSAACTAQRGRSRQPPACTIATSVHMARPPTQRAPPVVRTRFGQHAARPREHVDHDTVVPTKTASE